MTASPPTSPSTSLPAWFPTSLPRPVLALHGGAGTIRRASMSADMEARYRAALAEILADGATRLARGEAAMDVAVEAVRRLEECELFNAGKGAVYTADQRHELDASVMDGRDRCAGAVAGVTRVRNPVLAARAVMTHSGHVLLVGTAADSFAFEQGLERVAPDWFGTPQRLAQLAQARASASGQVLDHDGRQAVVDAGGALVQEAGRTMDSVLNQVRKVTDLMGEINASTEQQSQGIVQVNEAVAAIDRGTQQNAALVEESAAATESLRQQAVALTEAISRFKVRGGLSAA